MAQALEPAPLAPNRAGSATLLKGILGITIAAVVLTRFLPWPYRDDFVDPRDVDRSFHSVTADGAAALVLANAGRPRVVYLYEASCAACRDAFPDFVKAARSWRDRGIAVAAFSLDTTDDALRDYLGASSVPFVRTRIERWHAGELTRAFSRTGIVLGETFHVPLIAVIDDAGSVRGQIEGTDGVDEAGRWLAMIARPVASAAE